MNPLTRVVALGVCCLPLLAQATPPTADGHSPRDARFRQIEQAKVVVVAGSADHMEQVLHHAGVDFVLVQPNEVAGLPLNGHQVVMVNCVGTMPDAGRERIKRFVAAGGFLYTTDHAVLNLIEKTFPDTIAWTRRTTEERIVPVRVLGSAADRGLLKHLGGSASEQWQTAGGGYAVKVLNPHRVQVLMESAQAAQLFGSGVIAVRFPYEDGTVLHVTGHFFTQPGQTGAVAQAGRTFEQFSANVVSSKKEDNGRVDQIYSQAPKGRVTLQASPAAGAPAVSAGVSTRSSLDASARVRVLEKNKEYARVRDEEGNEGWVPAAELAPTAAAATTP